MRKKRKSEKNRIALSFLLIALLLVTNGLGGSLLYGTPYSYAREMDEGITDNYCLTKTVLETDSESVAETEPETDIEYVTGAESETETDSEEDYKPLKTGEVVGYYSSDEANIRMLSNVSGTSEGLVYRYAFLVENAEKAVEISNKLNANQMVFNDGVAEIETIYPIPANTVVDNIEIYENYEYEIDLMEEKYESAADTGANSYSQYHIELLELEDAWTISKGNGVKVAVIDSGIDYNHEALKKNIYKATYSIPDEEYENGTLYDCGKSSRAYDNHGHGTHVAGIIAATDSNASGIVGVAPQAKIISIKSIEYNSTKSKTRGVSSWTAAAINEAVGMGAKVINMSLGGLTKQDNLIEAALEKASNKGVIIVCAAGNESPYTPISYPGFSQYTYAITNGYRSGEALELAGSSKYGAGVDFIAPGTSILSAEAGGGITYKSGTSMACPMVAGIFALLKARAPSWTRGDLYELLKYTALDLGPEGYDIKYGYGMPLPFEALKLLEDEVAPDPTPTPIPTPEPEPETSPSTNVSDDDNTNTPAAPSQDESYVSVENPASLSMNNNSDERIVLNKWETEKTGDNRDLSKKKNSIDNNDETAGFGELTLEEGDDMIQADGNMQAGEDSQDKAPSDGTSEKKTDNTGGKEKSDSMEKGMFEAVGEAFSALFAKIMEKPAALLLIPFIVFLAILFLIIWKKRKDDEEKED